MAAEDHDPNLEELAIEELIEASSFGSPEALARRRGTPRHVVEEILAKLYGSQSDTSPET